SFTTFVRPRGSQSFPTLRSSDLVGLHVPELGSHFLEKRDEDVVDEDHAILRVIRDEGDLVGEEPDVQRVQHPPRGGNREVELEVDRKSTRLNSSHDQISYAVFCL